MNYYDEPIELPSLRDLAEAFAITLLATFASYPFVEVFK